MFTKITCDACIKSIICRILSEYSICLTMVRLKSNNLNLVDKEITKKFGSDAKPFKYK